MLRPYFKTWVKCGKRVTIGGGRSETSLKIASRILRMTSLDIIYSPCPLKFIDLLPR